MNDCFVAPEVSRAAVLGFLKACQIPGYGVRTLCVYHRNEGKVRVAVPPFLPSVPQLLELLPAALISCTLSLSKSRVVF